MARKIQKKIIRLKGTTQLTILLLKEVCNVVNQQIRNKSKITFSIRFTPLTPVIENNTFWMFTSVVLGQEHCILLKHFILLANFISFTVKFWRNNGSSCVQCLRARVYYDTLVHTKKRVNYKKKTMSTWWYNLFF